MSPNAFSRYAPYIQEYIYEKQWKDLHQVQNEACDAILDTEDNVIIASGTASGKTEAAFFPILTRLEQKPGKSVSVLYIGPLKALINDQFLRLQELLDKQEIPVFPWHGDISAQVKKRAMSVHKGIVQITPESLEAMLMHNSPVARNMFSDLQFVVIDEMHAFMGTDRGEQLRSLLVRLQDMTGCIPRRIGLSATLADYKPAMEWLSAATGRQCSCAGLDAGKKRISLGMESFIYPVQDPGSFSEENIEQVQKNLTRKLYQLSAGKKCIIFANSRSKVEELCARLKALAASHHEDDVFYVHHGSVAAAYRRQTEAAMKVPGRPAVICATNTLELGIDIGDLDLTIQYGAPYSVSSFVQRLGRSGRRSGKSSMFFVHTYFDSCDDPFARLPWQLLQSLAVILLYIEDRFIEPFESKPKPFSLLAHQTVSLLYQYGELQPRQLARQIFRIPAFAQTVSPQEYLSLLRYMVSQDILEETETKTLIPGLKGESLAGHYTFYSVFQSGKDWQVYYTDLLGTVTQEYEPGSSLVLNGKTWRVIRVHEEARKIYVEPHSGMIQTSWAGRGGIVHPAIVQKMRQILSETADYPLLKPDSLALLHKARKLARDYHLLEGNVYPLSEHVWILVPWQGNKINGTLKALLEHGLRKPLKIQEVEETDFGLYVSSALDLNTVIDLCRSMVIDVHDTNLLLSEHRIPKVDAYDSLVDPALLREAYKFNCSDIPGAVQILRNLKRIR